MNCKLFSCQSNNNFMRSTMMGMSDTCFFSPRRKDLIIYECRAYFQQVPTRWRRRATTGYPNRRCTGSLSRLRLTANWAWRMANFHGIRATLVLRARASIFPQDSKAEGAVGWRKATIINAALGSKIGWASYLGNRLLCLASNRGSRVHLGRDTTHRM